ncbi:MAG: rhodanese-like domain-containing protein [Acidimicrobiia bacterium]|nr:MAG: rhodanese-like domain-containing protein [Acidimicrobiia bacterium]
MMFGRKKSVVDVATARQMAENDGWVIVDVRKKDERLKVHVPGSLHYSLDSLNQRLPQLQDKRVLAICQSGVRSETARKFLAQNGVEALSVKGGMIAWTGAGLPTKSGK